MTQTTRPHAAFTVRVPFSASLTGEGHLRLDGELDIAGLDTLREALDLVFCQPGDVVIDGAGLTFIDSKAIAELLRFELVAVAQGRRLLLHRPSASFARVIKILDLGHIFVTDDHLPGRRPDAVVAAARS